MRDGRCSTVNCNQKIHEETNQRQLSIPQCSECNTETYIQLINFKK